MIRSAGNGREHLAWVIFAFEQNGENPHIWTAGVALTEKDANKAVHNLGKQGIVAWSKKLLVMRYSTRT